MHITFLYSKVLPIAGEFDCIKSNIHIVLSFYCSNTIFWLVQLSSHHCCVLLFLLQGMFVDFSNYDLNSSVFSELIKLVTYKASNLRKQLGFSKGTTDSWCIILCVCLTSFFLFGHCTEYKMRWSKKICGQPSKPLFFFDCFSALFPLKLKYSLVSSFYKSCSFKFWLIYIL